MRAWIAAARRQRVEPEPGEKGGADFVEVLVVPLDVSQVTGGPNNIVPVRALGFELSAVMFR